MFLPLEKCMECGMELPAKKHLKNHQRFHREPAWKEAGYVDPNNANYPTFLNPTNSRLAFFISNILGLARPARRKGDPDDSAPASVRLSYETLLLQDHFDC